MANKELIKELNKLTNALKMSRHELNRIIVDLNRRKNMLQNKSLSDFNET